MAATPVDRTPLREVTTASRAYTSVAVLGTQAMMLWVVSFRLK